MRGKLVTLLCSFPLAVANSAYARGCSFGYDREFFYCQTPPGDCGGAGTSQPRPGACTLEFVAVCGCDGDTCPNERQAVRWGVSVGHEGS